MTLQGGVPHRQHSLGDIMPQFEYRITSVAEIYFVPEREPRRQINLLGVLGEGFSRNG